MFAAWHVLASGVSVEDVAIKMLTNTGSTGIAIFLAYILYKVLMARKDRKLDKIANAPDDRDPGRTMLGGSNPAGTETSGVVLSPEKQPVTNEVCEARQRIITTKIDAVGEQVGKLDKSLADTNRELRETAVKLTKGASKLETCVAVLEDRANRDR